MTCRYFPTLDPSSPYFQARPDNSTVPAASIAAMPQQPGAPEDAWLLQVASPFVPGGNQHGAFMLPAMVRLAECSLAACCLCSIPRPVLVCWHLDTSACKAELSHALRDT